MDNLLMEKELSNICHKTFCNTKMDRDGYLVINNIPYDYFPIGNTEVYMPLIDNIFESDFDDIYVFNLNMLVFVFKSISRENDMLKEKSICFLKNVENIHDSTELLYTKTIINDEGNSYYESFINSGFDEINFIIHGNLISNEENSVKKCSILIDDDELSYYVTTSGTTMRSLNELEYAQNNNLFKKIVSDKPLNELAESLIYGDKEKQKIKQGRK